MNAWWSAVVALGMAGLASADDDGALPKSMSDGERRMLSLEERLHALESKQESDEIRKLREAAEKEKQAEKEELPSRVSKLEKSMAASAQTWDASKMLSFASPDGNFTAKIGGRIYMNYRHIFDRDDGAGAADTFWVDTARFQLEGSFYKDFIYRVEGEAKSGSAGGAFQTKDVWMGWVLGEIFTMRAGQMKVPFSQEETTSSRFIDFAERSIMNRWIFAHNQGVNFSGAFADKAVEWSLGVYNTAISRDAQKGAVDTSDEKMLAGRVFVSPFRNQSGALKHLRVGVDAFVMDVDDAAQPDISAGDLGTGTVTDFGGAANLDGLRTGWLLNLSYLYGPFSLRGEYAVISQELIDGLSEDEYEVTMYNLQVTFLLTGEEKPLENRVKPKNNFNPLQGTWGAVELVARIAAYEVGDEAVDGGIIGAAANRETTEVAFGVNWWWAPNVAWRFNYVMLSFDEDLVVGAGNSPEDGQDIFIVRWQIDF